VNWRDTHVVIIKFATKSIKSNQSINQSINQKNVNHLGNVVFVVIVDHLGGFVLFCLILGPSILD
jgi:hypothetical protein